MIVRPEKKKRTNTIRAVSRKRGSLIIAVVLLSCALFVAITLKRSLVSSIPVERSYLIPWIILVLVITLVPAVVLIKRRRFRLYNPLVYATWSFFIPVFVFGSGYLLNGNYQPWVLNIVYDPKYYLPLALILVAIGFVGLSIGFALPIGRQVGLIIKEHLPRWDFGPNLLLAPGVFLIIIGQGMGLVAYLQGSYGYQYNAYEVSTLGTFFYSFFLLYYLGVFLIWFAVFRKFKFAPRHLLLILLLISSMLFSALMGGGKGGFFNYIIIVILAYLLAGRRPKLKQGMFITSILVVAIIVGTIYGIGFRQRKSEQATIGLWDYIGLIGNTIQSITQHDNSIGVGQAIQSVQERVEDLSSFAVIVSNYSRLRPLEEQYGLDNNIWTYTWTAFIPRFIWHNKPLVSDARAIGALYFGYGNNSFAITPMGDLLRNYGPVGVLLGMALLGLLLRIMYSALVENQSITAGHAALYAMLLSSVSYEGFYGTIVPSMMRQGFVIIIGLFIVNTWIMLRRKSMFRNYSLRKGVSPLGQ